MPAADVEITVEQVRELVADQFPHWRHLPLVPLAQTGFDNAIFRLGTDLVVRLPRRRVAVEALEHELRWLPRLAPELPVPIAEPVAGGRPGRGYPWPWGVYRWIDGDVAATARELRLSSVAAGLGRFVAALHRPAPASAPAPHVRGGPLISRDEALRVALGVVGDRIDRREVERAWKRALAVPAWSGPPMWVHGDLHPANLVVAGGELAAVIDFGDLCAGDPATDLLCGWMLFAGPSRERFRQVSGADRATWDRGRGWALAVGVACLASSADNPVVAGMGRRAVAAVLADG